MSIFDYWSLESIQSVYTNRETSTTTHTEEVQRRRALRESYRKLLHAKQGLISLRDGAFFDLMYCNPYATSGVYLFMRYTAEEVSLVAIRFSDKVSEISWPLPRVVWALTSHVLSKA